MNKLSFVVATQLRTFSHHLQTILNIWYNILSQNQKPYSSLQGTMWGAGRMIQSPNWSPPFWICFDLAYTYKQTNRQWVNCIVILAILITPTIMADAFDGIVAAPQCKEKYGLFQAEKPMGHKPPQNYRMLPEYLYTEIFTYMSFFSPPPKLMSKVKYFEKQYSFLSKLLLSWELIQYSPLRQVGYRIYLLHLCIYVFFYLGCLFSC